ncbi:hypothetical protein KAR91_23735 [Candidatus Pacearchaeota archaeon]|nr:hypothetical protein [Candidatus Pacearchaeota archaeon]
MKIQVEIDVFDDSDLCNRDGQRCDYSEFTFCALFRKSLSHSSLNKRALKCDQCKEAFQKAKNGDAGTGHIDAEDKYKVYTQLCNMITQAEAKYDVEMATPLLSISEMDALEAAIAVAREARDTGDDSIMVRAMDPLRRFLS